MDFLELRKRLCKELGIRLPQLDCSFRQAKAMKRIDTASVQFSIENGDPRIFMHACGGKIPIKLFHIQVIRGDNRVSVATVYSWKYIRNGREKYSVTISPSKKRSF